jgi:hypothetical protein
MRLKDLELKQANEDAKAEIAFRSVMRNILDNSQPTFSALELFPELKQDLQGKEYTNLLPNQPISFQLPFYESVVMPIEPVATSEGYKKLYGISIEQTIDLAKNDMVIPILEKSFPEYQNTKNGYMDTLLQENPPTFERIKKYVDPLLVSCLQLLRPDESTDIQQLRVKTDEILTELGERGLTRHKRYRNTGMVHLQAKGLLEPQMTMQTGPNGRQTRHYGTGIPFSKYYAEMCLHGFEDLAESLIAFMPDFAIIFLASFSNILINTPYMALGGIVSTDRDQFDYGAIKLAKRAGITTEAISQPFPIDVGRLLIEKFKLISFRYLGFEELLEVRDMTQEARAALIEFDRAVIAADINELHNRKDILQETWKSANEGCEQMFKGKRYLKGGIESFFLSLGVAGPLAASIQGSGIIQALLYASGVVGSYAMAKDLLDRPLDMLVKATKPSYITALYDLSQIRGS